MLINRYSNDTFNIGETAYAIITRKGVRDVIECTFDSALSNVASRVITGVSHIIVPNNSLFRDSCDARSAMYARDHDDLMRYMQMLNKPSDFITFAMTYPLNGNYINNTARLAFQLRAKELNLWVDETTEKTKVQAAENLPCNNIV